MTRCYSGGSLVAVCCAIRGVQRHAHRGVGHMAEDKGVSPLPRRVPGGTDSPQPPRVKQPVLPESVRQRLLLVIAREQERAAREPEAPPPEEAASQGRPTAPAGTDPPQQRTASHEEVTPPERA